MATAIQEIPTVAPFSMPDLSEAAAPEDAHIEQRTAAFKSRLEISLSKRMKHGSRRMETITVRDEAGLRIIENLKREDPRLLRQFVIKATSREMMDQLNRLFSTDVPAMPTHLIGDLKGLSDGEYTKKIGNQLRYIQSELMNGRHATIRLVENPITRRYETTISQLHQTYPHLLTIERVQPENTQFVSRQRTSKEDSSPMPAQQRKPRGWGTWSYLRNAASRLGKWAKPGCEHALDGA